MTVLGKLLAILAFLGVASEVDLVYGQTAQSEQCSAYSSIVNGGTSGSVPVVPSTLLTDSNVALPCLVNIIERLSGSVELPVFKPQIRSQFLSATGAVRSMISSAIAADQLAAKQSAQNSSVDEQNNAASPASANKNLLRFIEAFRKLHNPTVARVLAYGLRSDDQAARSNALLILANVVDNRTVCVEIDHLYDDKIGLTPFGVKGRANLLAVVSIVAPWAYRETYENIENMIDAITGTLDESDPAIQQTRDIIKNIDQRLKRQTDESNKAQCLPADERDCYRYSPEWAKKTQLRYPDKANVCAKKWERDRPVGTRRT